MKKKIAILYPAFMGGGAEAVCLWMIEALKGEYELSLFTFTNLDFDVFNNMYGTSLSNKDVRVISPIHKSIVPLLRYIFSDIHPFYDVRQHLLMRHFKHFKENFDLAISGYQEMDMGKKGIQYIHWPHCAQVGKICRLISQFSEIRMKKNVTITNSKYVRAIIKKIYGIDTRVIYPPVKSVFPYIPWEEKEEGFVCSGRLVPVKEVDRVIMILKRIRAEGYNIHLHITSGGGSRRYEKFIMRLQKQNASWLFLQKELSREEYAQVLSKHKYGIHMKPEPFGIVVAEMVKAGCIPFVRSERGQVEIVDRNESLIFNDQNEAVRKIASMLSDNEKQNNMCSFLKERGKLYSEEKFKQEIQEVVREFFDK